MAFGRSNSLSINTGASNTLFGSTNQTSQPPAPAGGLFSNTNANNAPTQPTQTGGLFGRVGTAPAGGLFGNNTSNNQQNTGTGTSLFNNTTSNTQQAPNTGGTGLFGSTAANTQQSTSGTGLFGNPATNAQQNTGATSLFGAPLNQSTQQQSTGTSLFGTNNANRPTTTLFGSTANNNATQPGSTFGGSLFGQTNPNAGQQSNTSFLGGSQQQQQSGNTFMGMTAAPPGSNQSYSLLGASQFRGNQQGSFQGRLTLGQTTTNPSTTTGNTQAPAGTGAVKINYDSMKSTTRFADLVPEVQQSLERIDYMIQAQERFCRQIEAFIPNHGSDIATLKPDVDLVTEKTDAIETALSLDAQAVQKEKGVLQSDIHTGERLQRVVDNLRQPPQFHTRGADAGSKDLDLIGHYFRPLASDMEKTLKVYADAIAEIEEHMGILEASAIAQSNGKGRGSGVGTVQELAETLSAFEDGILGAAGLVGQCREGVNELVLGRRFGGR